MADSQKHTPGPWTADTHPPEDGISHYVKAGLNQQIPIACTRRWDSASAADARLIAAAPDLLEACEALIVGVVSCTDAGWTDEERALAERFGADGMNLADIITGARAAIAKARPQPNPEDTPIGTLHMGGKGKGIRFGPAAKTD